LQKAHEFMLALPQRLTDSKFIENLSRIQGQHPQVRTTFTTRKSSFCCQPCDMMNN
jgi:hypothetical protein